MACILFPIPLLDFFPLNIFTSKKKTVNFHVSHYLETDGEEAELDPGPLGQERASRRGPRHARGTRYAVYIKF